MTMMKKILTGLLCVASTLQAQVEYEYPIDHGGVVNDAVRNDADGSIVPRSTVFTFSVAEDQEVNRIRLRFAASHSFVSDIEVILKSPDGTEVRLFDGIGWDGGLFMNTYFDDLNFTDAASEDIGRPQQGNDPGTDIGPWSGSFQCEEQGEAEEYELGSFIGVNSKGTWQLIVTDYVKGDTGYIYTQDDDSDAVPSDRSRFGSSAGTALFVQFETAATLSPIAQWRVDYFGSPANIGHGGNNNDFDQDGVINLLEYALGRDPTSALSEDGRSALPEYRRDIPQNKFVISMDLPSPAPGGILYQIQASGNLVDWDEVARKSGSGSWVVTEGDLSETAGGVGRQIVELAFDTSGHTRRWFRLQIVEEP
jgi:hypothetical protein